MRCLLLRPICNHRLRGDQQTSDRSHTLQSIADDLRWIDDAWLVRSPYSPRCNLKLGKHALLPEHRAPGRRAGRGVWLQAEDASEQVAAVRLADCRRLVQGPGGSDGGGSQFGRRRAYPQAPRARPSVGRLA
jgi:hypothetical protein